MDEELATLHYKRLQAIDDLDFETAEDLTNKFRARVAHNSNNQLTKIKDEARTELNLIQKRYYDRISALGAEYKKNESDIKKKYHKIFKAAQDRQLTALIQLEQDRDRNVENEKGKKIKEADDLISDSQYLAYIGQYEEAKSIRGQADEVASKDLNERIAEVHAIFEDRKTKLFEFQQKEAERLNNQMEQEKIQLKQTFEVNKEKLKNQFRTGLQNLKNKSRAKFGVVDVSQKAKDDAIRTIDLEIEESTKKFEEANEARELIKEREELRTATLEMTQKNMRKSSPQETPEQYLRRTATAKMPKRTSATSTRYLTRSFFATQAVPRVSFT